MSDLRLLIFGKQGAGKGTQAVQLAEHYGIEHLSTGDLFRAQAEAGTEVGLEAKTYMDEGQLAPDELVIGVVNACIGENGSVKGGYILDGFPRTRAQAESLQEILATKPITAALNLEVPIDIAKQRMLDRAREDDTPQAIEKRLALYESETKPVLDLYRELGLLVEIDGSKSPEEVFELAKGAIDKAI